MTASVWSWFAAAGILAVLDWIAVARQARRSARLSRPAVGFCFLVAAAVAHPDHAGVHAWLVGALALGLIGDLVLSFQQQPVLDFAVLIPAGRPEAVKVPRLRAHGGPDLRSDRLFGLGLLSFLAGHLSYSAAMIRFGTDQLSLTFGLILALIVLFACGYRVLAGSYALAGPQMTVGVTAYTVALGSAVVLGIGTTTLWIAYGILLFAVADLVLAWDRYVQARPWAPLAVVVSYHLAQAFLLVGLAR